MCIYTHAHFCVFFLSELGYSKSFPSWNSMSAIFFFSTITSEKQTDKTRQRQIKTPWKGTKTTSRKEDVLSYMACKFFPFEISDQISPRDKTSNAWRFPGEKGIVTIESSQDYIQQLWQSEMRRPQMLATLVCLDEPSSAYSGNS